MKPPALADKLLKWFLAPHMLENIQGDLHEEFEYQAGQVGERRAQWLYWWEVLGFVKPRYIIRQQNNYPSTYLNSQGMFRNYVKIALRNMLNNKAYSFINIGGLAVGMAVAITIGLWVQHEVNFDDFQVNKSNIAIVMKKTSFNNEKGTQSGVMLPLYAELKSQYPEIKHITRLDWGDTHSLVVGDQKLSKSGHFADPDFLKMFSFPLVSGRVDNVLKDPYSIVLTESLAGVLFGKTDPIGKMIRIDNKHSLMVTGILKDVPKNSSITFDFLMPYELNIATDDFVRNAQTQWKNNFMQNFVELNDGVTPEAFSDRIEHLIQVKLNDKKESALFVHPMEKWHLYSDFKNWENVGGAIEYVRLFAVIGVLVLLIACINFMNLSTARSEKRAKEVGIRKSVGSQRNQLILQFLSESMLTTFIAFILSLGLVKLFLSQLKDIGFQDITFDFDNFLLLGVALAGCILTGFVAGSYPALYLSRFTPVKVLKGRFHAGKSANILRKVLVVTQFSFSIALIIGTIIVFKQIQFAKNRPLGYNPELLLSLSLSADLKKNFEPLKEDLLATGYVEAIGRSSSPMTGVWNQWDDFSWAGLDPTSRPLFATIMVDTDYQKAAGVKLKEGRFFAKEFATDSNAVVLNEAAIEMIGIKNPVGKTIKFGDETMQIIGVSQNVLMGNPFEPVMPAVMLLRDYFVSQSMIRIKAGKDVNAALAAIQPLVEKYNPAFPFEYRFVDDVFDKKFTNESQVGQLAAIFAVLAIFISCLGLFGLALFIAEQRTKEIGVRKVLGASVLNLWVLLSKDFVILVLIAFCIAVPFTYNVLDNWLQKYEYRADLSWWIFALSGTGALAITLLTVSYQSIKAALLNPVKSLRTE